jgi:hypothetical protein
VFDDPIKIDNLIKTNRYINRLNVDLENDIKKLNVKLDTLI